MPTKKRPCTCGLEALLSHPVKLQSGAESQLAEVAGVLQTIADWPFNIAGDCVADARSLAKNAIAKLQQGATESAESAATNRKGETA